MKRYVRVGGLVLVTAMAMGWTSPRAQECSLVSSEWAPRGSAKTTRPEIVVTFTSTCGAIDVSSVHMTIDDETVAHTVKGSGQKITVSHTPPSALTDDADHTVTVNVRDDEGTTGEKVWTFNIPDSYSR